MSQAAHKQVAKSSDVRIRSGSVTLEGELVLPEQAQGVVLFAHGSGSSRHSPRNQFVARTIHEAGIGTLLFDLLTREEEGVDRYTRHLRFDIELLAERLIDATCFVKGEFDYLRVGYFGASTGAAAALVGAAALGEIVGAIVSRGGRPDLARDALSRVKAPTLLIIGELDYPVISLNEQAYGLLHCEKEIEIVPGATHLFEENGALEQVARLAASWFQKHLANRSRTAEED